MSNKEKQTTKVVTDVQGGGKKAAEGDSKGADGKMAAKKSKSVQAKNKASESADKKVKEGVFRDEKGRFTKGNTFSDKYDEKYADALIEFFKKPLVRIEYEKHYDKDGNLLEEIPIQFVDAFPTMGMFAMSIGVSLTTIKSWAGISDGGQYMKPRFAAAYQRAKEWAGGMIESGALSGKLNANMAKFVLTNDYGKRESQEINVRPSDMSEKDLALIRRVEARLAAMDRAEDGDGEEG